jgi:hypothetical protein
MVEYVPPPENFEHLNPIQRYMQKGSLDRQDYVWLFILVLAYFTARPYLQELFKRFFGSSDDLKEGEQIHKDYVLSKAKKSPNAIRGQETQELSTIPEGVEETTASGAQVTKGKVSNRKNKDKAVVEQLLEWDDEPERMEVEGDKNDVVAWMDKWSDISEK